MAVNPYANYSPEVQSYLNRSSANTYSTPYIAGGDMNSWRQSAAVDQGMRLEQQKRDIEWANQQRMSDPAYWANAFSGSQNANNNTLADLSKNIEQSPAYKWRYEQGLEAVNRTAAAKRMLGSGNRLSELVGYGQGMASQEYGAEADRQLKLKELATRERLANAQMAMSAMEANRKYGPPQTFNFPGGIITRY